MGLLLSWWVLVLVWGWVFGFELRLEFDDLWFVLVCLSLDCWFMIWFDFEVVWLFVSCLRVLFCFSGLLLVVVLVG